jgi:hypothetical protein
MCKLKCKRRKMRQKSKQTTVPMETRGAGIRDGGGRDAGSSCWTPCFCLQFVSVDLVLPSPGPALRDPPCS